MSEETLLSADAPAETTAAQPAAGTTPESQTATETPKPDDAKTDAKPEETKPTVPDKYDPFSVPDGMAVDEGLSGEFGAVAKELGLPQDQAQKLVDFYTTTQQKQIEAMNESWVAAVKSDPEIGGAKLDASLAVAAKAVDAFGGQELRQFFDETGMGNHPAMVKLMINIGKRISEDSFIPGQTGGETKSAAEVLYPNHK